MTPHALVMPLYYDTFDIPLNRWKYYYKQSNINRRPNLSTTKSRKLSLFVCNAVKNHHIYNAPNRIINDQI